MKRGRVILVSVLAGAAIAVGLASTRDSGDLGGTVAHAPALLPLVPSGPPRPQPTRVTIGGERLPVTADGRWRAASTPTLPSTARVALTKPDAAGGLPWAVRTYQRRTKAGNRIWCAQLGREIDGTFAWLVPGERTARTQVVGQTETTVCTTQAPIAERLGIMVASLPDRDSRDPAARIATTLIWGVVDKPVDDARVQHDGREFGVSIRRHAFLKVLPGSAPATRARLIVRDRDGGERRAIPPGFYDMQNPGNMDRVASPSELRPFLRMTVGTDGVTKGLFMRAARAGRPACYTPAHPMVAGRAVWPDRRSGLVREAQVDCAPVPREVEQGPVVVSAGWTSGDPQVAGTARAEAARRARVERRLQYGSGGLVVVVPKGARYLEVRSPVGVKTTRIDRFQATWVGWDGQPEVQRAMFPPFPGSPQWEREIKTGHTPVALRALDDRGRQIGKTAYQGKVDYSPATVRRQRRDLARMEREIAKIKRDDARKQRAKQAERERLAVVKRLGGR